MPERFSVVDLRQQPKERVTAVVAQIKLRETDLRPVEGLSYVANIEHVRRKVCALLENVTTDTPDVIAFPELAIPESILPELREYSKRYETIVVAGSHYEDASDGRIAVSPVFIDGERYDVHKLNPSPYQNMNFEPDSLRGGRTNYIFKNTRIGNFAVLICADFLHDDLLGRVNEEDLDFLIVPSCQAEWERYIGRFAEQVRDSKKGVYALFPNLFIPRRSEGRSAILGVVDKIYVKSSIERRITDGKPEAKLWEAAAGNDYVVATFDLRQKKPPKVKTKTAQSNVVIKRTGYHAGDQTFKLIAFDLDGTLLRGTTFSWVKLWDQAGDKDGALWKPLMRRYKKGEFTYPEWCNTAVAHFRKAGLTKEKIAELARECTLTKNFDSGIQRLKNLGFNMGIISGGIDVFLEVLIPDYHTIFDFVYINRLLFGWDGRVAAVEPTAYDFEAKYDALEFECDERNLAVSQTIFVGDQRNDAEILKRAGHSIVYSDHVDAMELDADKTIDVDDFEVLTSYVETLNCERSPRSRRGRVAPRS